MVKTNFKHAFTLVELVITIGIVIIITGGALLYLPGISAEAKASSLKANLSAMRKVIDDYYSDFGAYPPTLDILTQETAGGYRYISKIPEDPTTGLANWDVSTDEVTFFEMDDPTCPYVAYIRSKNEKYQDY
ncbi:MAG: hypothetical protein C0601_08275 [Candidatus Muiribacterium halophilum]|uniref:Type II secretion system protein GspG C-terminal domain-containing protein n=1 Tax=Muiribacterium halophilum TaxID=2053465 RepID=A0A2N5ZEM4_MUIH1|nr:MAG: hypothetical protein C0601_08275 [Candidatus Muirbacterium halophilum]